MITILTGQNDARSYKGRIYGGIRVTVTAIHGTTNTVITQAMTLLQNLTITAVMRRLGIEHQICSLTGDQVPACVFQDAFDFFDPANTTNAAYQLTVVAAAGANETGQICFTIPFGSPIDLRSSGEIILSAMAAPGIFNSFLNQSTSNVTLDLEEVAGAEVGLPRIIVQPVQASDSNPSIALGDGVRALFFVNRDKGGITTANQVLTSVTVSADERMNIMNYNQLLAYRNKMFPNYALAAQRAQTFCLLSYNPDKVYYGVTANASTNSGNVTSAKNYWVAWQVLPSAKSLLTGKQFVQKQVEKTNKYLNSAS